MFPVQRIDTYNKSGGPCVRMHGNLLVLFVSFQIKRALVATPKNFDRNLTEFIR